VTFAVDDVDAITARARELGGSVLAEPQNAPWVRFAVLADPAGASFTASQFVAENRLSDTAQIIIRRFLNYPGVA
jgi:uncharacterized protein